MTTLSIHLSPAAAIDPMSRATSSRHPFDGSHEQGHLHEHGHDHHGEHGHDDGVHGQRFEAARPLAWLNGKVPLKFLPFLAGPPAVAPPATSNTRQKLRNPFMTSN